MHQSGNAEIALPLKTGRRKDTPDTRMSWTWMLGGLATILSVYTFMVWAQYPVPGASKGVGQHGQPESSGTDSMPAIAIVTSSINSSSRSSSVTVAQIVNINGSGKPPPTPIECCAGAVLYAVVGATLTFYAAPSLLRTASTGYRIGDVVAGKMSGGPFGYWGLRATYALAFPDTIAYEYLEMTDEPWRIDVLAAITTRRAAEMHASSSEGRGGATHIGGRGDGGGSSDMLVVHLRLGDVLGQTHAYGGFDLMRTDSTDYIKNASYYASAFDHLPRGLTKVTVVGDYRHTSGIPHAIGESIRYRRQVEDYFAKKLSERYSNNNMNKNNNELEHAHTLRYGASTRNLNADGVEVEAPFETLRSSRLKSKDAHARNANNAIVVDHRYEHEPDDDILFMTSASHFCVGGGGFSMVVGKVARQRGAKMVCGVGSCWPAGSCGKK
eukprot:gene7516-7710_t